MISKISRFFVRNKNKLIITGCVVGGAILATRYAHRKLRAWQEKQSLEFIERTKQSQHFDGTELTCNQTIMSLAPQLCEAVCKCVMTEDIIAELKTNPDNKVKLWSDLKIHAFSKVASLVYTSSVFVVTLRVQLSLLGGYVYKDSKNGTCNVDRDMQARYLSLCHNLLGEGVRGICKIIEDNAAVAKDPRNPLADISKFVLPTTDMNSPLFSTMIAETRDLLETEDVKSLLTLGVSQGFATMMDHIAENFIPEEKIVEVELKNEFVNMNKLQIPMAKMIPIVNGLVGKTSEVLVEKLIAIDRIKVLGANVYETFCH
ncbi:peroxisomal biogenesis factor 3-like [Ctenocephalides felis]|uniref:peroxisomal biogenesis factor 3-like n=1 Tax=Ctenocephalides felis TaxID=7515 RepID=UPI000E6E12C8|nr:peroxisomal biogenesis factor 3-like [Ctenocephalides felis]